MLEYALMTDERLTEAAREIELNKMEALHQETLANLNEEKAQELEVRLSEMRINHEESLITLEATLVEEHRAKMEAVKRQLRNQMAEVSGDLFTC
jgi:hypothetical protein